MHQALAKPLEGADLAALYERPVERATSACVFCVSEKTSALSPTQLRRHLARHLEALLDLSMMNDMIGLRLNTTCSHCVALAMVGRNTKFAAREREEIMKRLVDSG